MSLLTAICQAKILPPIVGVFSVFMINLFRWGIAGHHVPDDAVRVVLHTIQMYCAMAEYIN